MLKKLFIYILLLFMPFSTSETTITNYGIIDIASISTITSQTKIRDENWDVATHNKKINKVNKIKGYFAKAFGFSILLCIFFVLIYVLVEKEGENTDF